MADERGVAWRTIRDYPGWVVGVVCAVIPTIMAAGACTRLNAFLSPLGTEAYVIFSCWCRLNLTKPITTKFTCNKSFNLKRVPHWQSNAQSYCFNKYALKCQNRHSNMQRTLLHIMLNHFSAKIKLGGVSLKTTNCIFSDLSPNSRLLLFFCLFFLSAVAYSSLIRKGNASCRTLSQKVITNCNPQATCELQFCSDCG